MTVPSICAVFHGPSGVGKSRLGGTAPAPRCILDPEGGSRFLPGKKVWWNPFTEAPPVDDGTWETCLVRVDSWDTAYRAYEWFAAGQHPFRSIVLDSISELQRRLVDNVAGVAQPTIAQRGEILRGAEDYVRKLRDLTTNPIKPVEAVILLALTEQDKGSGTWKAAVSGKLATSLPGFVDVVGYYFGEYVAEHEGAEKHLVRKLLINPIPPFEAKDRTDVLTQHYGPVITTPNVTEMLEVLAPLFA